MWNKDRTERRIEKLSIDRGDVSLCAFGCSPTTTATARASLSMTERRALTDTVGDWAGPWALRAANQWGSHVSCPTCSGSGDCADCSGSGQQWVGNDDSDGVETGPKDTTGIPNQTNSARRHRTGDLDIIRRRAGLPIPPRASTLTRGPDEIRIRYAALKKH